MHRVSQISNILASYDVLKEALDWKGRGLVTWQLSIVSHADLTSSPQGWEQGGGF